MVTGLEVQDLVVRYGDIDAVAGVSFALAPGEVLALVGPSGCGKTSLLRAVAGLEAGAAGSIRWDGEVLDAVPAHRRGFGLMFQDHALFPHLTVGGNVAYGLKRQGRDPRQRADRVAEVLALVGLSGWERREVGTLSGGEAQRVALARSLAPAPRLLMFDEPLGSLDRVLRERLAADLRAVLSRADVAALLVTHDQEEAYAVADRLAVMRRGRLVRDGLALEVWRAPGSPFVARFLGHPNVLDGATALALGVGHGGPVVVPEAAIVLDPESLDGSAVGWQARVADVRFKGSTSLVTLELAGGVRLALHRAAPPAVGSTLTVQLHDGAIVPLDLDEDPKVAPEG